jgi:colanic acid/amylovoran biosynthesis glycosyltransferase
VKPPERPQLRIGYLLSRAPQPESTFTNDEIATLAERVALTPVGLIANATASEWILAPRLAVPSLWKAAAKRLFYQPRAVLRALTGLVKPAVRHPKDAVVAFRAALAACYLADTASVDLIHAQFAGPGAAGAFVWHCLTGLPYTVRAHAYDIYRPYAWAGTVFRNSAAVVAISDHGAEKIQREWGVPTRLIRVGVPRDSVPERGDHGVSQPPRFLTVGALIPKKGHELLIAATNRLSGTDHRVTLDIYGDGPLRDQLIAIANPEVVRFLGPMSSSAMRATYRKYDAFALAARIAADGDMDGIPVVLMEASLAGLPVVTTHVAGIPELIENEVTGVACEPTAEALAAGIVQVVTDYSRARRYAAAARQRVRERHDLARTSNELVELWSVLLGADI